MDIGPTYYLMRAGMDRDEDVWHARINPLVHYIRSGYQEARNHAPEFETNSYILSNSDGRMSGSTICATLNSRKDLPWGVPR